MYRILAPVARVRASPSPIRSASTVRSITPGGFRLAVISRENRTSHGDARDNARRVISTRSSIRRSARSPDAIRGSVPLLVRDESCHRIGGERGDGGRGEEKSGEGKTRSGEINGEISIPPRDNRAPRCFPARGRSPPPESTGTKDVRLIFKSVLRNHRLVIYK